MSIEVTVRQRGFFHKTPLELEDLTGNNLKYGIMDFGYRLIPEDTKGGVLVVYDPEHIGRGAEAMFEEGMKDRITLRLTEFGTTVYDVNLFYEMIERICHKWDTEEFEQGGRKYTLYDIEKLKEENREFCMGYFRDAGRLSGSDVLTVTAVMMPLRIPAETLEKFGKENDEEGYAKYLHDLQSVDAYYALPALYQSRQTGEIFGLYAISAGADSIISRKPELPLSSPVGMDQVKFFAVSFYVFSEKTVAGTIRYEDFANEVLTPELKAFDDEHVILPGLPEERIREIVEKYPGIRLPEN